jgi:hypothetical protein
VLETTFLGEASEHVLAVNGERVKVIAARRCSTCRQS